MKRNRGFTLVEVLVSMLLLSVGFVAIWTLFAMSMKTNVAAGDQTECAVLAQQRMEQLKNADYDSLVNGGAIDTPLPGYSDYVDVDADNRNDFLVSWAVAFATAPSTEKPLSAKGIEMMSLKVQCQALRAGQAKSSPWKVLFTTFKTKGEF